ncbi:MAG: hypothetical protein AB3N64_00215 [Puniceicoccaceae bacterium]
MGILGFLVQVGTACWVVYLGYVFDLNFIILLLAPLGFIFGHVIKTNARSSSKKNERGFNAISGFFSGYFVGLVAVAIFFGIGYGLFHILEMRPAEGVGRY